MDGGDLALLRQALRWRAAGLPAWLVTVARTWGSSPRPPGALLIAAAAGEPAGSVGGGCVEAELLARLRAERPSRPQLWQFGGSRAEAARLGLPCGGRMELLVEPLAADPTLAPLCALLEQGRPVQRSVALAEGSVTLEPAGESEIHFDGARLVRRFGSPWRLLLIGGGEPARRLAQLAPALDFAVTVCDPRPEFPAADGVTHLALMPDDAVAGFGCDGRSAVITLAHDPRLDDLALVEALPGAAGLVGALGSRRSHAARCRRLLEYGLPPPVVARLRGPVGVAVGSRTPAEIAVAIAAELIAWRRGVALPLPP